MGKEKKVPRADAEAVAALIMGHLDGLCERCEIAGSIRRKKEMVSDIEIVYIPKMGERENPGDMFDPTKINGVGEAIKILEEGGILEKRLNKNGHPTYGVFIKLMRHVKTGIGVDFFACSEKSWWNIFTMRTGGEESNKAVSNAAIARGLKWKSSGEGFQKRSDGSIIPVNCEEDVFRIVDLPYLPPEKRL